MRLQNKINGSIIRLKHEDVSEIKNANKDKLQSLKMHTHNYLMLILLVCTCFVQKIECNNNLVEILPENILSDNTVKQINEIIQENRYGSQPLKFNQSNNGEILVTPLPSIDAQQTTTIDTNHVVSPTPFQRNNTALANYKGYLDPAFVASINPFWLSFPPQSPASHYTIGIVYVLMMLFGWTGNLFVIFMYIRCRSLRTPANTLVINLAVSDFIMLSEAPMCMYNSFEMGPALGDIGCRIYGFVGGLVGTASIMTLTAISIDRYNVVVYPLNPLRSFTKLRSRLMVLFVWLYSLFFAIIPVLDIGWSKYVPEAYLTTCSFDYLSKDKDARIFMFLYFVFAWLVPFTAITYCYVHILRVVIGANSIQSSKDKNKTEVKLAAVVFAVIGLWFIAWTPYAIVALLGIFGKEHLISPLGSMVPAILCKVAACVDPYVYAVTHPRFRLEFGKMFLGKTDTRHSQYQTSYTKATTNKRRGEQDGEQKETAIDEKPSGRNPKLGRAASSMGESEISLSVDYSDQDN